MSKFTQEELAAFRAEYAKGATDTQFDLFIAECEARNLRPGTHLVFQTRSTKEKDETTGAYIWVRKPYWITTIGALRLIAQRTGQFAGQGPEEYIYLDDDGNPSIISQIPLPQKGSTSIPREPWAVRVAVHRKDWSQPVYGMARFEAVAGFQKTEAGVVLNSMWAKRGPEQAGKCALADGIRKVFSEETSSLFLSEELKNDEPDKLSPEPVPTAVALPEAPSVPKVDQTPAVPTNNPRPGEVRLGPDPITTEEITEALEKYLPKISLDLPVSAPVETTQVVVTSGGVGLPTKTEVVETPLPEPKKRGRKPKPSPENGRPDLGTPNWESAEEMEAIAATPAIEKTEANKVEAQEFVEAVTSFTNEQAAAQKLPPPEDPLPDPRAFDEFVKRMRACTGPKIDIQTLGAYSFNFTGKTKAKFFTVGDWTRLLDKIEGAKFDDKLAELVKQ